MTRQELEAIAYRWIGLWNAPLNWQIFHQIHATTFQDMASAGRPPTKQGFATGLQDMLTAFPDLRTHVEDLVVDVEHASIAVRWSAVGTNKAKYLGVGPTHQLTTITGIEIIYVVKNQIVKRWGEWDISAHTNA